ncbi:alpha/beta fold hydrolase [Microbispora sp. KK1-11]|uniref:alpha/beta fold hydrolase n=1 Tax=Microbispora sp. KK1-11 TaxID=2053005 RepID=UPI00115C01F6|nr:alpha/beta fold hydrolase [Microbispora sp. KK1-11]TQS20982.1 alpha/beta fold hydrolase [Microbispora sp. KK1-11]
MEIMYVNRQSLVRRAVTTLVTVVTCGTLLGVSPAEARTHDVTHTTARIAGTFPGRAPGGSVTDSRTWDRNGEKEWVRHSCASAKARCDGELEVPLDWGDPASERITVAFAWLPRKDLSRPAEGTVLANPGGPLAALPNVPSLAEALGPVLDRQNLLVVEPRGLGKSSPLLCPELDLEHQESVSACAAHLGPRAGLFTADQAVADMDAVREALGVPKVTFYGISYGTVFAQAYATRYPRHLSGLLLDSVMPTGEGGYVTRPIRTETDRLRVACQPSQACRRLQGDPPDAFARLVRHLRAHPDPHIRPLSLMSLTSSLSLPMVGREVNASVAAYSDGDPLPLRRLVQAIDAAPTMPLRAAQLAGFLAYVCGDSAFPFERAASPAERRRQLDRFYAQKRPFQPFTIADLGGSVFGLQEACVGWPTYRPSPPVPPGAKYPRVPTLTLAGDFDSTTPAEAAEVTRRFPGAVFSRVRFAGHNLTTGLPMDECVRATMRTFLIDLNALHGTPRCDQANYRATGSFPRVVKEVPPARGTGLAAGERRILAAAFATVADATARRNPLRSPLWLTREAGLRGGMLTFDDKAATIRLRDVRFVDDLTVNGEIHLNGSGHPGDEATAKLDITSTDGSHPVRFSWKAFHATDDITVTGTLAERPFTGAIPQL